MGGWIAGISVFCFAASYTVALALEVSRMLFRSGIRGAVMLGFAVAGLAAQILFLGYRAYLAVSHSSPVLPLSSSFDWFLIAALLLVGLYLYLTIYHPTAAIGLFLLPVVLVLIVAAEFLANDQPFSKDVAGHFWLALHLGFWMLGTVAVLVGFVAGIMYFVQAHRLRIKKLARRGLQLPSLEWLERINSRALGISVLGLTVGFISALVLNLVNHAEPQATVPWTDPVIVASALVTLWVLAMAVFNAVYKPAQHGHKVAYLTVTVEGIALCQLAVSLLVESKHGSPRSDPPDAVVSQRPLNQTIEFSTVHPEYSSPS